MLRCCEYWSVASYCGTYIVEYLAKAIGGLLGK